MRGEPASIAMWWLVMGLLPATDAPGGPMADFLRAVEEARYRPARRSRTALALVLRPL